MTFLSNDSTDWSGGPAIGNGLVASNQVLTITSGSTAVAGPYFVGTAEQIVVDTLLGAPLAAGNTVTWTIKWLKSTGVNDFTGFVTQWNQSVTLGNFLFAVPVLGPYFIIQATTTNATSVLGTPTIWKVKAGVTPSQAFGPVVITNFNQLVAANTVVTLAPGNYVPGPAILTCFMSVSGGYLRFTDSNGGVINPTTFYQYSAAAANQPFTATVCLPPSDFNIQLGLATTPSCGYVGSLISMP